MANKNYPHPVLSPFTDDYNQEKATFEINITERIEGANLHLLCSVKLTDENLLTLLEKGNVVFVVKLGSAATRYRDTFEFNEFEKTIIIPASNIEKKIELSTFIVAKAQINDFSSVTFHEDYEGVSFSVYPGDILAEGSDYILKLDKKIDPLTKVPSIFTIISTSDPKAAPMDVRTNENQIIVVLNDENFEQYKYLKKIHNQFGHLSALTSAIFITPALVMILENIRHDIAKLSGDSELIKEHIEDLEIQHRWFKVINMRLKDLKIDLLEADNIMESSLVLVQKLLGDSTSNGLKFFKEVFSVGTNAENEEVFS